MNSLLKLSSILLLSSGALTAHAASQSVTVNYTLTVPTACTLSKAGTTISKSIPVDGTTVNETFDVTCNVDYTISAKAKNASSGQLNMSVLQNSSGSLALPQIPYNINFSALGLPVPVNDAAGLVVPSTPIATPKTYTLSASSPIVTGMVSTLPASDYTDEVTIQIAY
ncbi:spore coat protein U domain-containing protein [Acinetobacter sp. YH16042]|uniref:spore coat protein U domain-containing protein n=1 Tax=Acinetobacter sp. YH16042 TaxID=2601186 RepID=UPI0015D3F5E4|nr:spore coat protein U domain-containing protein [Acinetobacter sp. YH16042]